LPGRSEEALTAGCPPRSLLDNVMYTDEPRMQPAPARRPWRGGGVPPRAAEQVGSPQSLSAAQTEAVAARRAAPPRPPRPRPRTQRVQPAARACAQWHSGPEPAAGWPRVDSDRVARRACGCPPTRTGSCSVSWTPRLRTLTWWCTSTTRRAPLAAVACAHPFPPRALALTERGLTCADGC
jgi:hypothetical protein